MFTELVDYWLADLDLEGRLAPSRRFNYERDMRQAVLPYFEHLTLREIGVARCDALLKELAKTSHARSERAKTVLRLAFGLTVRHDVMPRNPIDGLARLHKPKRTPTALTAVEVNAIRAVIKAWEQSRGTSGPNPDAGGSCCGARRTRRFGRSRCSRSAAGCCPWAGSAACRRPCTPSGASSCA